MRHTGHGHRGVMADAVAGVEAGEDDPACRVCRRILTSGRDVRGAARRGGAGEAVSVTKACPRQPPGMARRGTRGGPRGAPVGLRAEPTSYDEQAAEVCASPSGRRSPGCSTSSPAKD
ncbi:hypothetical protein [Streptomyces sp. NPDC004685]